MIGIAFIGVGNLAGRHAEALRQSAGARLVVVWSPNAKRCRDFADRQGSMAAESTEASYARSDIDALLVLAVAEAHVNHARAAMETGKRGPVEKPVATDAAGFHRLRETAAQIRRI